MMKHKQSRPNKLQVLLDKVNKIQLHYHSKVDGMQAYIAHKNGNTNTLDKDSFVPPSPLFSYMNRFPKLAGYGNQLLYWDTSLCIRINRLSYDTDVAGFFKVISRLGDGWFWYVMLIISFAMTWTGMGHIYMVIATIMTGLLGVAIYKLLKVKTVRPRPYQVHQVIQIGERPLDVFSFPSGHTLQAVLFTCALGGFFPILLWVMIPFTVLVAISRMVLGLHYPTDVLVGAVIGLMLSDLADDLAELMLISFV